MQETTPPEEYDPFGGESAENYENSGANLAPPKSEWYHGRLDRPEAEQRLLCEGGSGRYLVRQSDRTPGSYVVSYRAKNDNILHFRVTACCGDFYMGGRKFVSLEALIGHYMTPDRLMKQEWLQQPVPPPEPVLETRRVIAVLPYSKMPETDEISFETGDKLTVVNELDGGWLWCVHDTSGEQGMVFAELVTELLEENEVEQSYPWFHENISSADAIEKLKNSSPGSFLVRPSERTPRNCTLYFRDDHSLQRFSIERRAGLRYYIGGRVFDGLAAVINHYKKNELVTGFYLGDPILKPPPDAGRKSIERLSEEIYATLRASRDRGWGGRESGMHGMLLKKSTTDKKWKNLYFVCSPRNQHLYFYDRPKRAKPKGLIDLSYTYLYGVHDTLLDKPFCFQLVERALPCLATVSYLCAPDLSTYEEWMKALKPLCVAIGGNGGQSSIGTTVGSSSAAAGVTQIRSLHITLLEAHRLPIRLVPHPFCIISLNQVKVARTQVKCPPDPIWEEDFFLEDIPSDVNSFAVTLLNKGKKSSDAELAEVKIDLSTLKDSETVEEWYNWSSLSAPLGIPILGRTTDEASWGAVRMRIRFTHEIIMPEKEYGALKELLIDESLSLVCALSDAFYAERTTLASTLLDVFACDGKEALLLSTMNKREIQREEETSTLFRAASLTTALMDLYMKLTSTEFLNKALGAPIKKVLASRQSCELNPSRLESSEDACKNAEFLLSLLDTFADSIFAAIDSCPRMLRYICNHLQTEVTAKWPHDPLVKTRVVSGFIFLRLLCPAILNPRHFNIISESPSEAASRCLILVAKCLQNLANLVEFGTKESWMEVVNPFILKNKNRMIRFLDELANVNEKPESNLSQITRRSIGDPARQLALLHRICELHRQHIESHLNSKPILKKVLTVVDMLTSHKEKYMQLANIS